MLGGKLDVSILPVAAVVHELHPVEPFPRAALADLIFHLPLSLRSPPCFCSFYRSMSDITLTNLAPWCRLLYTDFFTLNMLERNNPTPNRQSARAVLMVSPASFAFDPQTAVSNSFQTEPDNQKTVTEQAMAEFRTAVDNLRRADIEVIVHEGFAGENKPNAVFPNNWLSTWPDGRVFTYPMATPSRRVERDSEVLRELASSFAIGQTVDLSGSEKSGHYLESTGVIVFDHLARVAYGCISERCNEELFNQHVTSLGYRPVTFHAYDDQGVPIYHTNVMMALQSTTAVICSEAITDPDERKLVVETLKSTHKVIDISPEQMTSFCGNVLELENVRGEKYLALSRSAYDAFTPAQRKILANDKTLLPTDIPTIESVGGGSMRCMLAEVFLEPVNQPDYSLSPSKVLTRTEAV